MISFLKRLTSRKFLLALGSFITFIAMDNYNEAMAVVMAYLAAEGAGDVAERYGDARNKVEQVQDPTFNEDGYEEPDYGNVEAGDVN